MTTTLTKMNRTREGYTKNSEQQVTAGEAGAREMNTLISSANAAKQSAKGWSFGIFEDGLMSGATWDKATAIVLDYEASSSITNSVAEISSAADKLNLGYYLIDGCDRQGVRTIAVVFPITEHVSKDRYARLCFVLMEEMKAQGCRHLLVKGTSAMTHMIHIHASSEVAWIAGPPLNPTAKIKATKFAAQNMDRDRFTVGAQAAVTQLAAPTWTACDDGLFEGL